MRPSQFIRHWDTAVTENTQAIRSTHFFPRAAAMLYDGVLVLALWFPATALLLPFTDGEAVAASNLLYPIYLLSWGYGYFLLSWRYGGRTLGMKAWRLHLINPVHPQQALNWRQSLRYAAWATASWLLLGLGYACCWLRQDRRSLHELRSGLQVVRGC